MEAERRVAKLGRRSVEAAAAEAATYRLWDSDLKGFGLKVSTQGIKTYFVWYRAGQGRAAPRREYTIGRHGEFTPQLARDEAAKVLGLVRLGHDPQANRQHARKELTVAELCDRYLIEGVALKKASTIVTDTARIRAHIKPLLGKRSVSGVTADDVDRFMRDIAGGKTAKVRKPSTKQLRAKGLKGKALKSQDRRRRSDSAARGGKGTATRTVGLLGSIFAFAVRAKLRADNPVRGVKRFKDNQSQRFLSATELGRLTAALSAMELAGANRHGLSIIRLLLLTGARKGEIEGLRWSEVDIARSRLALEDSKTGARFVPLGAAALEVFGKLPISRSEFVFPGSGDNGRHYVGTPRLWAAVLKSAGLQKVRLHDLRHTYASFGVAGGLSLPMIGAILGHRDVKTTQQYAHLADDPVRAAADLTAGAIAGAMAANDHGSSRSPSSRRSL